MNTMIWMRYAQSLKTVISHNLMAFLLMVQAQSEQQPLLANPTAGVRYHVETSTPRVRIGPGNTKHENQVVNEYFSGAEKILKKREVNGKREFLVKWKGLCARNSTWEPNGISFFPN